MSEKQPLVTGPQTPSAPQCDPPPVYSQGGGYQSAQQNTSTTVYIQPQQQTRNIVVDIKPPNYIIPSVLTLVLCCWIFGLIALITGLQVDSAWNKGDADGAHRFSQQAKRWNVAAIVGGVIAHVVYVTSICISVGVALSS